MRYTICSSLAAFFVATTSYAHQHEQQVIGQTEETRSPYLRVAIVGAGAAGSSAAYHLAQYAREADIPLNLTIFERSTYIGGRSTTVNVFGDSRITAELGASIFVQVNHILVDAVKTFNLTTSGFGAQARAKVDAPYLGIWDGREFTVTLSTGGPSWWDTAKLLWRYGLAPIKTRSLMKSTVGKFLSMYDEPSFPFPSLTHVVNALDLSTTIAVTGSDFLESNGIGAAFAHDIVQASTRVNYAQNLPFIHGLETMVCMATDGAVSVEGGNWQIFDHMVRASKAVVLPATEVRTIRHGRHDTIIVNSASLESSGDSTVGPEEREFDGMVIAAPFHQTNITASFEHFKEPEDVQYVELHVTLFTSPFSLSPAFFGLDQGQSVPLTVLTTLQEDESPGDGADSAGSAGFFSISTLDVVMNPDTAAEEYLYKIFSPTEPSKAWLLELLGGSDDAPVEYVTWIERKLWKSYPVEKPRTSFDPIEITRNVWYTGGMDPFISTMETNALMGKNVARLMADKAVMNSGPRAWPES